MHNCPAAHISYHLTDVKKVIAWVRENGFEYNADPTRIVVSGNSAGANLATITALTPNDPGQDLKV